MDLRHGWSYLAAPRTWFGDAVEPTLRQVHHSDPRAGHVHHLFAAEPADHRIDQGNSETNDTGQHSLMACRWASWAPTPAGAGTTRIPIVDPVAATGSDNVLLPTGRTDACRPADLPGGSARGLGSVTVPPNGFQRPDPVGDHGFRPDPGAEERSVGGILRRLARCRCAVAIRYTSTVQRASRLAEQ